MVRIYKDKSPRPVEEIPGVMTRQEAALYLAVSPRTLDTLRKEAGVPWVQLGRSVRFLKSDVDSWIASNRVRGRLENKEK